MADHTEVRPRGWGVTKKDRTLAPRIPRPPHQRVDKLVMRDHPVIIEPSMPLSENKKSLVARRWD